MIILSNTINHICSCCRVLTRTYMVKAQKAAVTRLFVYMYLSSYISIFDLLNDFCFLCRIVGYHNNDDKVLSARSVTASF